MCLCLTYENEKDPQYIYGEQKELINIIKKAGRGKHMLIQLVRTNQEDPSSDLVGICAMIWST